MQSPPADITMSSFWSLILEPGKKYKKTVEVGIQVTRATLDTSKAGSQDGIVQVILEHQAKEMIIANLSIKHGILQTQLDLLFQADGEEISFASSGAKIPVLLTGHTAVDDDSEYGSDDELDDPTMDSLMCSNMDDDSDEEAEIIPAGIKRKIHGSSERASKQAKLSNGKAKALTLNGESFLSDDDEGTDANYNPMADSRLKKINRNLPDDEDEELSDEDMDDTMDDTLGEEEEEGDDDDEEGDDDDEEGDDDEEDEESEEEEMVIEEKPKKKEAKTAKVAPISVSTPKQKETPKDKTKKKDGKTSKSEQPVKSPKTEKAPKSPKVDKAPKSPKIDKAVKSPKVDKAAKSPKTDKTPLKSNNKENIDKTPKQDKKKGLEGKKEKMNGDTSVTKTPKQMRTGGVMIEDVSIGSGAEAKSGQQVSVYYQGTLKSNNKCFDKLMSGPPLKFRLGRAEVIKGWDVGVAGMKVGGKRKIMVPPQMAYGKQGAMPEIPPNSFLNFEVTLLNTK